MKSFPKSDKGNFHVFNQELDAMFKLQHTEGVATLMDLIEDDSGFYLVLSNKGDRTLKSILGKSLSRNKNIEVFARQTVGKIGKIVAKMHKKKVMHRRLNPDSIMMSDSGKVASIVNFDFALHIRNGWMVQQ